MTPLATARLAVPVAGVVCALLVWQPASFAQPSAFDRLLVVMAASVRASVPLWADIVVTEDYVQERRREPRVSRRLRSEILLAQHPAAQRDWLLFRDVLEVDGGAIPERQRRLTDLFITPTAASWTLAREIAQAGGRHHLPGSSVAITNPFIVVALMDEYYRPFLRFKQGREETVDGKRLRHVQFEERVIEERVALSDHVRMIKRSIPLLVTGLVEGSALVDPDTGRIMRTQLRIGHKLGAPTAATTFVYHEPLSVMVPREMTTSWREPDDSRAVVSGTAVYSDVRRFQVSTEEAVRPPLRDP